MPCTPLAIIKILEYLRVYNTILPYGNRLFGHSITVVNRSEVVGRPLAALLANDGACVYSVDVTGVQQFTRGEGIKERRHKVVDKEGWGLKDCVPLSDVVITGVPGNSFNFPTELLREGAVCINFSTEKVSNFQLSRVAWHFRGQWSKVLYFHYLQGGSRESGSSTPTLIEDCVQNFGPEVKEKASIYVPAIGKVTIVMLLRNLVVSTGNESHRHCKLTIF